MTNSIPLLCFRLCGQRYALSVPDVVEVASIVETAAPMEQAHAAIHGVIIRQGEPILLTDLRRLFHCDDAPISLDTLMVIARQQETNVGFIVDQVDGVVYFDETALRLNRGPGGYIRGLFAQDRALIQWLNLPPIMAELLPKNE